MSEPIHVRSASEILRRGWAMCALNCRGYMDGAVENSDAEDLYRRLTEWVEKNDLRRTMSDREWKCMQAAPGTLPQEEQNRLTWLCEGLGVIAWYLVLAEHPLPAKQIDAYEVTDHFLFLNDVSGLLAKLAVRPAEEMQNCREFHYNLHCRLRAELRGESAIGVRSWFGERKEFVGENFFDGEDLAVAGVPIAIANREDIARYETVTGERHRAAIWICGDDAEYDSLPVNT